MRFDTSRSEQLLALEEAFGDEQFAGKRSIRRKSGAAQLAFLAMRRNFWKKKRQQHQQVRALDHKNSGPVDIPLDVVTPAPSPLPPAPIALPSLSEQLQTSRPVEAFTHPDIGDGSYSHHAEQLLNASQEIGETIIRRFHRN